MAGGRVEHAERGAHRPRQPQRPARGVLDAAGGVVRVRAVRHAADAVQGAEQVRHVAVHGDRGHIPAGHEHHVPRVPADRAAGRRRQPGGRGRVRAPPGRGPRAQAGDARRGGRAGAVRVRRRACRRADHPAVQRAARVEARVHRRARAGDGRLRADVRAELQLVLRGVALRDRVPRAVPHVRRGQPRPGRHQGARGRAQQVPGRVELARPDHRRRVSAPHHGPSAPSQDHARADGRGGRRAEPRVRHPPGAVAVRALPVLHTGRVLQHAGHVVRPQRVGLDVHLLDRAVHLPVLAHHRDGPRHRQTGNAGHSDSGLTVFRFFCFLHLCFPGQPLSLLTQKISH